MEVEGAPAAGWGRALVWFRVLAYGLTAGLTTASVLILGYGWWHRVPAMPFQFDHSAITALLWRTTVAVALCVVLVGVTAVVRAGHGRVTLNARPVGAAHRGGVAGVCRGGWAYLRSGVGRLFEIAASQQAGVQAVLPTTVIRAAWWCGCLAVVALAGVWVSGFAPAAGPGWFDGASPRVVLAVALVVVVAAGSVVGLRGVAGASVGVTAERVDIALPEHLSGEVAYRVPVPWRSEPSLFPGGAGFLLNTRGDTVEGFDGATGQRRWVLTLPGFGSVTEMGVTGFGPDSVAVLQTWYGSARTLLGVDATTGTVLWASRDRVARQFRVGPLDYPQLSQQVVLVGQVADAAARFDDPPDVTWIALSPRTGAQMWSTTVAGGCGAQPLVALGVVVVERCDAEPFADEVAWLLDPLTGQRRGAITASSLGVDRRAAGLAGPVWVFPRRDSVFAQVVFRSTDVPARSAARVIDLSSGRLAYSIPEDQSISLFDATWVAVDTTETPYTLVDLASGMSIRTDRVGTRLQRGARNVWARVGRQFATFLPAASGPARARSALTVIGQTGAARTVAYPCEGPVAGGYVPTVTTVPGALLVSCGNELVGLR